MLGSDPTAVRRVGGEFAGYAALEWALPDLLTRALTLDAEVRAASHPYARTTSTRPPTGLWPSDAPESDERPRARGAQGVAKVAGRLRDKPLRPFAPY